MHMAVHSAVLLLLLLAAPGAATFACGAPPPRRAVRCSPPAADAAKSTAAASISFSALATPNDYRELLANAAPSDVSVIKYQSPFCRSCRQPSQALDDLAQEWPQASFYTLDLLIDGKAAGRRMKALFKERNVKEIPYVEVYRGSVLVEAGVMRGQSLDRCIVTPIAVSCVEGGASSSDSMRPLHRLMQTQLTIARAEASL